MYEAIRTVYKGPTDKHGARIVASAAGKRRSFPMDDALSVDGNHAAAAQRMRGEMGWHQFKICSGGWFKQDAYWIIEQNASA